MREADRRGECFSRTYVFSWRAQGDEAASGWVYTGRYPDGGQDVTFPGPINWPEIRVKPDWSVTVGDEITTGFNENSAFAFAAFKAAEQHGFSPTASI